VAVDSHVTIARPDQSLVSIDNFGIAMLLREPEFAAMGVGSTGQTELSRARVSDAQLLIPDTRVQQRFTEVVTPIRTLSIKLMAENSVLRSTRDLLLPRLISGEIGVSELDIDVEDTAA
jgi:type I restriction enzyme, S subunit